MDDSIRLETPEQIEIHYDIARLGSRFIATAWDSLGLIALQVMLLLLAVVVGSFLTSDGGLTGGGTCKEGVLWFGALRPGAARSATIIEGANEPHTIRSDAPAPPVVVTEPRAFLWEPDACVIRATLVAQVAHQIGASQIDEQIAYLTSDAAVANPFVRGWPVIEHAPFNLKELNRRLRALDANVTTVKKRGSPIEPETFRRRLKSNPKGQPITVFITRVRDQPWMILCGPELPT